jgi:eukaryotic-like serine/threonine-protein kinase
MTTSRWDTITRIFDGALEIPAEARPGFVRDECGQDSELESEVLRLLKANELAGSFLERPILESSDSKSKDQPSYLPLGTIISDRFQILRFVGEGGMGQVYEALDLELKGRIALKTIRPDISSNPRVLARFRREVQLTRRITHPNVCRTFDIERHADSVDGFETPIIFLTMELLEGETLASLLRREARLTSEAAFPLVVQMAAALDAAHSVGVVHRDFKPSNIILVSAGIGHRVVITDFGLARSLLPNNRVSDEVVSKSLSGSDSLLGTPVYMAPEQLERGQSTPATDIYALGLVMFEMVTGQRPFADPFPFAEALKRIKQTAPSARLHQPALPESWERTICQCLQLEPEARIKNVREVIEGIERSSKGLRVTSRFPESSKDLRLDQAPQWYRMVAVIGIIMAVASLCVLALRYHQRSATIPNGASILMTEVVNQTADHELDAVSELLRHELSQSAYFDVVDRSKVRETLKRMTRPYQQQLDPITAREVAWRAGGSLVVYGSVTRVGPALTLDLRLERLGKDIGRSAAGWNRSFPANDKEDLFKAIQAGSQWIRMMAGEHADVFAREKPPQDTTTDSWEALLMFSQAEQLKALDHAAEAIGRLQEAVKLDPDFALGWMRLGDLSNYVESDHDGFRYWERALQCLNKRALTKREELRIKGLYSADSGDHTNAREMFQEWEVLYPNDYLPSFYLAGSLIAVGRYDEALEKLSEAERKQPGAWYVVARRARLNLATANYKDLPKDVQRLRELGQSETADLLDGAQQFIHGDTDAALSTIERLRSSQDDYWQSLSYSIVASLLSEIGRYGEAREELNSGIRFDREKAHFGALADKEISLGYLAYRSGDLTTCKSSSLAAVNSENGQAHLQAAGSLLARCGFTREATRIESQLKTLPDRPIFQAAKYRLAGEVLLAERSAAKALSQFEAASAIEDIGYPREYLGRTFLSAGKREEALKIYRDIAEHPGAIWQEPDLQFPGLWADSLFQYGRLQQTIYGDESQLRTYLMTRSAADPSFAEPKLARSMLQVN